MRSYDVIIVGGGPAGASAAAELLKAGYRTVVLDKAEFPREKLCAGWIPPSLFRLLGIDPKDYPHGIREYRTLHFRVRGVPLPIPTRQYAIRRYEFDHWLLQRSGVETVRHRVREIRRAAEAETENGGESGEAKDRFIIDDAFSCRYLIGAGGTGCPVAAMVNRQPGSSLSSRTRRSRDRLIVTMEEEFRYPKRKETCFLRFFDGGLVGYSWYFPKEDGYLTVGIGGKQAVLAKKGETIRDHWGAFVGRLERKGLVTGHEFSPSAHSYYLRDPEDSPAGQDGICLTGDAAGLATTDMGEGIEPAVHSGMLAASSIIEGKPYTAKAVKRRSLPDILRPAICGIFLPSSGASSEA